jgi:hypothetical protein
MECVRCRQVGEVEVAAEVRREADRPGEDRQREAGDDLVRAQRDHHERMDQCHRRAGDGSDQNRGEQRHRSAGVHALHRPEAHHGADQHHPLDPEVEHA